MAKFSVTVKYSMSRIINVYAGDEAEAEEKACEVVNKWKDVIETEAIKTEEVT